MDETEAYAVRNKEGKWFRSKGYRGWGDSWVDDLAKARIYFKPRGAKGIITFFSTHWSQYGVPDLVKLKLSVLEVIDQADRIKEVKKRKEKKIRNHEVNLAKREFLIAKKNLELAQERVVDTEKKIIIVQERMETYNGK